jgi:hypothetical protein
MINPTTITSPPHPYEVVTNPKISVKLTTVFQSEEIECGLFLDLV